jgi:hypothetical protein
MSNVPNTYAGLGFNYVKTLSYLDISAAATTKVVDLFPIPADGYVVRVGFYVNQFFDGGATSDLTLQLGVTGVDTDGFVAATAIHVDGTEVSSAINSGAFYNDGTTANTVNAKVYDAASATTLSALFTATGGNTSVLTQGKVTIFAQIVDFAEIE